MILKIGIIGYGAIGRFIVEHLKSDRAVELVAVLDLHAAGDPDVPLVSSLDELVKSSAELIVECAGHDALRIYGPALLRAGKDLLVASVGALADIKLESDLRSASGAAGRLLIPAGALGGLEALRTAREAGLQSVEYIGRKAPAAWRGTIAESLVDLSRVSSATTFLECDARTAALKFPRNANVVAALALAGLGFERTKVRLMVDPAVTGNRHSYVAKGAFGEIAVAIQSLTLPANPKTSMLAPFNLVRMIKERAGMVAI
jgi:aspartate dehydrogenase